MGRRGDGVPVAFSHPGLRARFCGRPYIHPRPAGPGGDTREESLSLPVGSRNQGCGPRQAESGTVSAVTHADICQVIRGRVWITVPEAGVLLGLGRSASYSARLRGEIPAKKIGRAYLVPTALLLRQLGLSPDRYLNVPGSGEA